MKLGVYIHGSSPFKPRETIQSYIKAAQRFEQLNFDSLWFADHLIRTPDPNESPLYETWTLIAGLSSITEKIRLGTMVTPATFRNIGVFAKMISTVDHLSQGRINVGLGAGWYQKEHSMFGLKLGTIKRRMGLLEDYIKALLSLWTNNKTNYESEEIKIQDGYLCPSPLQKPHPPILIGGGGEKITLRLVAKYGQMSNFGGDIETIEHKISVLKDHCDKMGRNFSDLTLTTNMAIVLGETEKQVEAGIKNYRKRFQEIGREPPSKEKFRENRLVGTPDEVKKQISQLDEIGIDLINLTINDSQTEKLMDRIVV